MNEAEKKRMVKMAVGGVTYTAVSLASRNIINKKVTKRPHKDIALQLSSTFWAIAYILYNYYCVGEKEE